MYPEDLVEQFHSLQGRYVYDSSGEAQLGTLEPAPVKTYRSTLTSVRSNIRYQMNKFLARRAQDPDSCVWETGHKEWAIYGADPIYSISDNTILLVLTGKGTVKEIKDVLKIVSLMLEEHKPNKSLNYSNSLRQFVADNVGHDCNGLVFSYLRTACGLNAKSDKKCWQYREKERARKSVGDVRERDLVFPADGGHILIVGRIWNRTADSFECYISEARSTDFGGAQYHHYRVKGQDGQWELRFLDRSEVTRKMGLICPSSLISG